MVQPKGALRNQGPGQAPAMDALASRRDRANRTAAGELSNARPGTPKVFGRMLTEEVYANSPNACVLESACRQVRRTKDFPPSIAEVLKAIDKEGDAWCERWEWLDPE